METIVKNNHEVSTRPINRMLNPKSILPSLYGDEVNPVASAEEELSLRESIAADGIQIPLTIGRVGGKGKYRVIKGTRRLKHALELGLTEVPVTIKEYDSDEAMRQDALRDNLERRHLSTTAKARLGYELWNSYDRSEDKKDMAAKGNSPRKRAAQASGVGEGTLAAFRFVLDSGLPDVTNALLSEKLTIDAAYREAKKQIVGCGVVMEQDTPTKMKRFLSDLDEISAINKKFAAMSSKFKDALAALHKASSKDRARADKKIQATVKSLDELLDRIVGSDKTTGLWMMLTDWLKRDEKSADSSSPAPNTSHAPNDKEDFDA